MNSEVIGVLCFNIDHTIQTECRAYIKHLTCTKSDQYENLVKESANFIWDNTFADCIRADLYHFKQDDKIQADTFVKEAFIMKKMGFKWKTMINDPNTDIRYQVMQMNRPNDKPIKKVTPK